MSSSSPCSRIRNVSNRTDTEPSVAAIVATHNRRRDLEICLDALIHQTVPLDAIYIIDNGSTDDTPAMVAARNDRRIRYHRLSENTGSAGGFRAGMELAYADGFDWLWITDNDSIPSEDCLERLLSASEMRPDVLALAPVKICTTDGRVLNCDCIWDQESKTIRTPTKDDYQTSPLIEVDWVPNTGLFVNRRVIATVGHLRDDLFAFGEDVEYCRRIRRQSKLLLVTDSKVSHPEMGTGWPVPITSLKKLYFLRRNAVYLSLRGLQHPKMNMAEIAWQWLRTSFNIVRKQDHAWRRLMVVILATYHGIVGHLGKAPNILDH